MTHATPRVLEELANETDEHAPLVRKIIPLEILLVDGESVEQHALANALTLAGHRVTSAPDTQKAISLCNEVSFDVAIVDVGHPSLDGGAVFRTIQTMCPKTRVVATSTTPSISEAVDLIRRGAYDYVVKPIDLDALVSNVIGNLAEHVAILRELEVARRAIESRLTLAPIVGEASATVRLVDRIVTVSQSAASVVVSGESGTGKSLVARTLHAHGPRKWAPFIDVDCVTLACPPIDPTWSGQGPGVAIATETFATSPLDPYFRAAHTGTLYLADVSALPFAMQSELLRVLRGGTVRPSSGEQSRAVDIRVVSSTQVDLQPLVATGCFREELLECLRVIDIHVPPLRERKADLPILVSHFLGRLCPGRVPPSISPGAWHALSLYTFPGNVRELRHALERGVTLSRGGLIELAHLPDRIARAVDPESIL